jgi:hypothetical protein
MIDGEEDLHDDFARSNHHINPTLDGETSSAQLHTARLSGNSTLPSVSMQQHRLARSALSAKTHHHLTKSHDVSQRQHNGENLTVLPNGISYSHAALKYERTSIK